MREHDFTCLKIKERLAKLITVGNLGLDYALVRGFQKMSRVLAVFWFLPGDGP